MNSRSRWSNRGAWALAALLLAAAAAWMAKKPGRYHATAVRSVLRDGMTQFPGTRTFRIRVDQGAERTVEVTYTTVQSAMQSAQTDAAALDADAEIVAWAELQEGTWVVRVEPATGAGISALEADCPLGQPLVTLGAEPGETILVGLRDTSAGGPGCFRIVVAGVADESVPLLEHGTLLDVYEEAAQRLANAGIDAVAVADGVRITAGPSPLVSGGGNTSGAGRIVVRVLE
jgi:hypothetical protein